MRSKKRKKIPIKFKKERVVLSDVLPYEVPVTYSNKFFYRFLASNNVQIESNCIKWKKSDALLARVIKLLFDLKGTPIKNKAIPISKSDYTTIPFKFDTLNKQTGHRELTIIHPKNQLFVTDFYIKNQELILYYSGISPFSIRKAQKVAKVIYQKDRIHYKRLADNQEPTTPEEINNEYENLRSYFAYKEYSNIHKFYESDKYHRCEQKYDGLFKFDLSKCFDSIYTHSIAWALLSKEAVKESDHTIDISTKTFAGKFDRLMRSLNHGETHGIVIGPEFSRIFAEIILQSIDKKVVDTLRMEHKLIHMVDYEIFRYVDDYFVFYNKEKDKNQILETFEMQFKPFKLHVNESKKKTYEKPIITELTIAKLKIVDLLEEYLEYEFKSSANSNSRNLTDTDSNEPRKHRNTAYVTSDKLITRFKIILKETNVKYMDIVNWTLSVVERMSGELIESYDNLKNKEEFEKFFIKKILKIQDFIFFLYAVSPRVNSTIKLCRILNIQTEYLKSKSCHNYDSKHLIFKNIYENICFILKKENRSIQHAQVETLYLLIALGELGREYWLAPELLGDYFHIKKSDVDGKLSSDISLNYFSIVVLLFYIKRKKRYEQIREYLHQQIVKKFNSVSKQNLGKHAELIFLLFDLIACPFVEDALKRGLLQLYDIDKANVQTQLINYKPYWFTKWTDFDFGLELDAKQSQEVY